MTLLSDAQRKAKSLNIKGKLQLSTTKEKKLDLILPSGKKVSFGLKGSKTFLETGDTQKRNAYLARHDKIVLKDGRKATSVKYSPAYLSKKILW